MLILPWTQPLLRDPSFQDPVGADDEAFGGGADKIEWVTSHQCEEVVRSGGKHLNVRGLDHLRRVYSIEVGSVQRRHGNFIVLLNIPQAAKEGIPMSHQSDVAPLAGERGSGNMPDRVLQSSIVYAFHDHGREADGADFDSP